MKLLMKQIALGLVIVGFLISQQSITLAGGLAAYDGDYAALLRTLKIEEKFPRYRIDSIKTERRSEDLSEADLFISFSAHEGNQKNSMCARASISSTGGPIYYDETNSLRVVLTEVPCPNSGTSLFWVCKIDGLGQIELFKEGVGIVKASAIFRFSTSNMVCTENEDKSVQCIGYWNGTVPSDLAKFSVDLKSGVGELLVSKIYEEKSVAAKCKLVD